VGKVSLKQAASHKHHRKYHVLGCRKKLCQWQLQTY